MSIHEVQEVEIREIAELMALAGLGDLEGLVRSIHQRLRATAEDRLRTEQAINARFGKRIQRVGFTAKEGAMLAERMGKCLRVETELLRGEAGSGTGAVVKGEGET